MKKLFVLLLSAAVILICFTACGGNNMTDGNPEPSVSGGYVTLPPEAEDENTASFPAFTSTTIDGEDVTEEAFSSNRLTMVNIWGTFCGPCINEMPYLERLSKDYAEKGVGVIGIVADVYDYSKAQNNDEKIKDAEDIIADTGVTYMNILPSESLNEARLDYINTFPTTYFINEDGEIVGEYIGSRSYQEWSVIIESHLTS